METLFQKTIREIEVENEEIVALYKRSLKNDNIKLTISALLNIALITIIIVLSLN